MKIRSVVIGVLAGVVVVGGVGYAAYYSMRGQAVPVEVAPVANMASDSYWFSYDESIWGSVTSQASQNVSLDSEYPIDEVYVTAGEEVTEGTPLFSYDMTLEEIELEGEEIELLSLQLQLSRSEKELEKYRNTTPTVKSDNTSDDEWDEDFDDDLDDLAFWKLPEFTLTALAAEDGISIESVESVDAADAAEVPEAAEEEPSVSIESVEPVGSAEGNSGAADSASGTGDSASAKTGAASGDLVVEEVEEVSDNTDAENEVYRKAVSQYEDLMTTLELYANEDGSLDYTKAVRKALKKAVNFYQDKLTDKTEKETVDENGETVTEYRCELKQNVKRVLDQEGLDELNAHVEQMEVWEEAYEARQAGSSDGTQADSAAGAQADSAAGTQAAEEDGNAAVTIEEIEEVPSAAETPKATAEPDATDEADSEQETTEETEAVTETETTTETDAPAAQGPAEWISSFLLMAEDIELSSSPDQASYRNALEFYQQYLAAAPTIITEEDGHRSTFQDLMAYQELNEEVREYLNPSVLGGETDANITEEELKETYERLCIDFCILLLNEEDEYFLEDLNELYQAYTALPEEQKKLVRNDSLLLGYALKYGLIASLEEELESELESELEDWEDEFESEWEEWDEEEWDEDEWDDWYDDDWDDEDWDDEGYTAEELEELINELEESIKELELDIRECELSVEQAQRVVDGKVVTSSLNGTVISVGDEEGNSDDDYFVRVASTAGLFAKGVISELELNSVNVGDEISGISDDGESFTAVIKEVSDYPDANGSDSASGSGNTNASYYTFYALIDDPEGIEEGYADLTLSDAFANENDTIWLEDYFVRTDSAGNNYVYVEGSDGKLEQRYVTVGKNYEGWALEITGGLGKSDMIAFPYGDNVYEGAPTKETDYLENLYGD